MENLKVGDKVKIKNNFKSNEFKTEIQQLANTYVTIRAIVNPHDGVYLIKETEGLSYDNVWYENDFDFNKYYIVSNKHTDGLVRTFWASNSNGYTIDLNEAGIYTQEDINKKGYPLITEDNLNDRYLYETYFITVKDIELIGKKMTCILN